MTNAVHRKQMGDTEIRATNTFFRWNYAVASMGQCRLYQFWPIAINNSEQMHANTPDSNQSPYNRNRFGPQNFGTRIISFMKMMQAMMQKINAFSPLYTLNAISDLHIFVTLLFSPLSFSLYSQFDPLFTAIDALNVCLYHIYWFLIVFNVQSN